VLLVLQLFIGTTWNLKLSFDVYFNSAPLCWCLCWRL